ncbi:ADP-ribosylation factor GTPase-activating protein GCS1 [Smittium mucronatum]|uniref:ADP-ribosylation factor GTPase-activating protein GCS1 n=1 Tax=Smittium mucronatum TaxID=133383 RepID=A0A1R0H1Y7_9FUNG|nr:ADP-ribosylation factor GTPase-activating protein GCS1 [Smittium mucronatum]
MSELAIKKKLLELQRKDGNRICMDCNEPNPMWASVTLTTFFCLNCSGQHRGLGVHLSFVRSVNMDKWSSEQVRRMEIGGNKKALEFFKTQPDYRDGMPIKEKYTSRFAELWRQKVTAEFEGRPWTAPPSAPVSQSGRNSPSTSSTKSYSKNTLNSNRFGSSTSLNRSSSYTGFTKETSDISNYNSDYSAEPISEKSKKEMYFSKLGAANRDRPDNLPPSQGGRYTGFGNSAPPQQSNSNSGSTFDPKEIVEDPGAALYKGFSLLTSGAMAAIGTIGNVAGSINENYIKPTTERVLDPNFRNDVAGYVSKIGKSAEIQASRGISEISKYTGIGNARANGYSNPNSFEKQGDEQENNYQYGNSQNDTYKAPTSSQINRSSAATKSSVSSPGPKKNNDWDDEWDNF